MRKAENRGSPSGEQDAAQSTLHRALLVAICFLAGAAIMVIEISGNRLLAPLFGNSIYTWTSLIGVILIAFSAGGYLGGWLADRRPTPRVIAGLLFAAAVFVVLVPGLAELLSAPMDDAGVIGGPLLLSLTLFTLPGILLGAVSPYSVRIYSRLMGDTRIGVSAGTISMAGSLGSFAGTFATGFILLSAFGVTAIFYATGAVLLALAGLAARLDGGIRRRGVTAPLTLFAAALTLAWGLQPTSAPGTLYERDTFHHRLRVFERDWRGRTARVLHHDTTLQGGIFVDGGDDLPLAYQNSYRLLIGVPRYVIQDALFIGAGAFGMPRKVSRLSTSPRVDVVEIDPEVVRVGHEFFDLGDYPNVYVHAADGRRYLRRTKRRYSLIYGDAYNGTRHIPTHLVTREFFQEVKEHLRADGVYMMNTLTALRGENAELLRALVTTLVDVFPYLRIFSLAPRYPMRTQNVILMASNAPLEPFFSESRGDDAFTRGLRAHSQAVTRKETLDTALLTDDKNRVEAIIARQLLR